MLKYKLPFFSYRQLLLPNKLLWVVMGMKKLQVLFQAIIASIPMLATE